jgi:hypothetical protein
VRGGLPPITFTHPSIGQEATMTSSRRAKLGAQFLALVGLTAAGSFQPALAQSAVNVAAATQTALPVGTFRGGLEIMACSGPGCRGGIIATFTNDGRVRLKWESEEEAYRALRDGKPWSRENTMENAGLGTVHASRKGTVSFDNGSYNHFDNCKFDGSVLKDCYFSRADNGQAVAWITLTKVK